jgi:hypothetical protein
LRDRIAAFEIEPSIFLQLIANVHGALEAAGVSRVLSTKLAKHWCLNADFLVADLQADFSHAVGNPPFQRTGGSRPDKCVAFMMQSFNLLCFGGRMAMVAPVALGSAAGATAMRKAISSEGCLERVESYEPSSAFARKVSVIGALFVIRRSVDTSTGHTDGNTAWLAGPPAARSAFAAACSRMPPLEAAGCRVRLGVATGKNAIFVRKPEEFGIEADLLVPVVATRDLGPKSVEWRGMCIPNTTRSDGLPWTRSEKPRLYAYLNKHRKELEGRHSVTSGGSWRTTHTRIDRELATSPKVLVAETANPCRVSLDLEGYMPLNSVHAVTSNEWPLPALHAILAAGAVGLVANALLLRRGGGHLRVNATALRQVRIPRWKSLPEKDQRLLLANDFGKACEATARIFGMKDSLLRQCVGANWG